MKYITTTFNDVLLAAGARGALSHVYLHDGRVLDVRTRRAELITDDYGIALDVTDLYSWAITEYTNNGRI